MEQVNKSLKIVEEAKRKAFEANEIAQTFLKPKSLSKEEEKEDEAPPSQVICQFFLFIYRLICNSSYELILL